RTYAHAYGTVDASDYTPPPVTGSMHRFCSTAQIDDADYQVFNVGGISALQSALPGNQFQMRLQFNDRETDNDGVADAFRSTLQLEVTYQP
ncbi:MAG: hypothetical protein JXD18_03515, partial [Anaerolineae bacterium]|nr:hypothetical protein [Anaerolineae bacterium]